MPALRKLNDFLRDERGATSIEYTLIASIFALCALVGFRMLVGGTDGLYGRVGDAFNKHLQ